jgi:hypothetical protein
MAFIIIPALLNTDVSFGKEIKVPVDKCLMSIQLSYEGVSCVEKGYTKKFIPSLGAFQSPTKMK